MPILVAIAEPQLPEPISATFCCRLAFEMAETMSTNSGLSEAPPTRKPSMSGIAESADAFLALAEPPYWMRIAEAQYSETFYAIQSRIAL